MKQRAALLWMCRPYGSRDGPDPVAKISHTLRVL